MSQRPKRVRPQAGEVFKISLDDDGLTAYAVALKSPKFAVFDGRDVSDVEEALKRHPMFYVSVMDRAVVSGRWPVVRMNPDAVPALKAPPTFIQDPINPEKFQIYEGGVMRPATRTECEPLERTAVWDPEHVEDRIRDAYAGLENRWLRSLQIDAVWLKRQP
ncbi:hypothetical protein [Luteibacter sp. UNCMF366Tsu5.1]|uniref:hypothetical protein n=1 Tax=Luteibacter sp. UNCMF366Tsu5.1 TaxID=1502758 RepID=UPI000908A2C8|nr:hypothetical protein [Luteibacter sp. UNCMF366Tsu5.1]SFW28170.1 hypothetical protein SAMN02800691_0747 [Luteibacter sp. UNCMF366Tsu5.1]